DVVGDEGRELIPVGRLDFATSGLLLMTTDRRLADWITDPAQGLLRRYVAEVRGLVSDDEVDRLLAGSGDRDEALSAASVIVRKRSSRETHLTVDLREGRNREIRRLFASVGHEVTRLKRVRLGDFELGDLKPGAWRRVTRQEVRQKLSGFK